MKILVADDSKTNLAIITNALQKLDHEVLAANSGQEAIDLFKKNQPDLIILDVVMEGMDGFECAKKLREMTINDENWIPIIFLSASVDDTSISKGIDAGGDDYLTKPFSEITLAAKIKAMQRIADMQKKLYETTQKLFLLSSTDTLTGLYNRLQFDRTIKEIVSTADRYHHMVALLFIDLDNFKNVNDSFGHHIGDLLLLEVGKRLKTCIRSSDFIARLGGDEFAIILSEIADETMAGDFAQKILDALSFDYNLENHSIRHGASIGIACYPQFATNYESLILNADVAMYHAKSSGRNNYQYFTDELNDRYRQQISLEHALKFALERNELYLTHQPIFDLQTKELVGIETLLCWDHPQFGHISPTIFIPIAEETGLINHIGSWVFKTACEQYATWPIDKNEKFKFSINISSRQFHHESFFQNIIDTIDETQVLPHQLEFELTETAIMAYDLSTLKDTIKKIKDTGISISIDDFGTGYSSLIRLKHLPIRTLKIEKSFIQDVHANSNSGIIVSCLIALGKNLGLNVIAEGIETAEQLDFLLKKGCPQGQGHYLCKPLTANEMVKFIKNVRTKKLKPVF